MRASRLKVPLTLLLIAALVAPLHGQAAGPPGPIAKAAEREAIRLARQADSPPAQPPGRAHEHKHWIGRHPVAFGALVGTGVGLGLATYAWSRPCEPGSDRPRCDPQGGLILVFGPAWGALFGTGAGLIAALIQWRVDRRHD